MATKKTTTKKTAKKTTARKPAAKTTTKAKAQPATKKPVAAKTKPATKKQAPAKAKGNSAKLEAEAKPKRTSALDAAAAVLAKSSEPLNSKQLIEAMAAQKLWTSPGGKTPHATLHAAISKEIAVKGAESRFTKAGRGLFAAKG